MASDISYAGRAWTIAKMQSNFSFKGGNVNVRSVNDLDLLDNKLDTFGNIKTLGLEMAERRPVDADKYLNNDKLKLYYVVNCNVPNVGPVKFIIDNTGKSLACELQSEEGDKAFILDEGFKKMLLENPSKLQEVLSTEGLTKHPDILKEITPKNVKGLANLINEGDGRGDRDTLPYSKTKLEEKLDIKKEDIDPEKSKENGYDSEKSVEAQKTKETNEQDVEEAAKMAGVSVDKLKQLLEQNGLTEDDLIGLKKVNDVNNLSKAAHENYMGDSTVVLLKVKGDNALSTKGMVINSDASRVISDSSRNGNLTKVVENYVPDHCCAETIDDMKEAAYTNENRTNNDYLEEERRNLENQIDEDNKLLEEISEIQQKIKQLEDKKAQLDINNQDDLSKMSEIDQTLEPLTKELNGKLEILKVAQNNIEALKKELEENELEKKMSEEPSNDLGEEDYPIRPEEHVRPEEHELPKNNN